MTTKAVDSLRPGDPSYPTQLIERFGDSAPACLQVQGLLSILSAHKVGLFCSARCPGDRILRTYEHVQALRDRGATVISGFHSPIEKECLRILLRGRQPVIICPARTLQGMTLPSDWRRALDVKRLLLLSPFPTTQRRASVATAARRNELVAALSDEVFIAHITPGGRMEHLSQRAKMWHIPFSIEA